MPVHRRAVACELHVQLVPLEAHAFSAKQGVNNGENRITAREVVENWVLACGIFDATNPHGFSAGAGLQIEIANNADAPSQSLSPTTAFTMLSC